MVEFGLKLLDNKVAEWSNEYMDYEKLKTLLKKAKEAEKICNTLEKTNPELAIEAKAQYAEGRFQKENEDGCGYQSSLSRSNSDKSIDTMPKMDKGDAILPRQEEITSAAEKVALIPTVFSKPENTALSEYGSTDQLSYKSTGSVKSNNGGGMKKPESSGSLAIMATTVKGYFTSSSFTSKFMASLREYNRCKEKFASFLFQQLVKVDHFYMENVQELSQRLDVLIESVFMTHVQTPNQETPKMEIENLIGYNKNVRSSKLPAALMSKIKSILIITSKHANRIGEISFKDTEAEAEVGEDTLDSSKKQIAIRESDSIKRAIIDIYRQAKLLSNYSIMNYTGFVKVIKKHDKNFPEDKTKFKDAFNNVTFENAADAEQLCTRMETIYAVWFCGSNEREARAQMLPKKGDGLEMDWTQLRFGFRLGMCTILALWVCWDCIWGLFENGNTTIGGRTAFPVFRACGGLLVWHWFWGLSVYTWTRYRVNYIFLFDFDPRIVDSPTKIFNDAVEETLVFLACMLLYYKAGAYDIPDIFPSGVYPFILVLYTLKGLVLPLRTRGPLWKAIREVISAPLTSPTFFNIYVADVFTSMVKVFQDIAWTICFVISGDFLKTEDLTSHAWQTQFWYKNVLIPLICLLPLWFRFNQCLRRYLDTGKRWPNLANAFKYALSQTVTLFGAFHPLYKFYGDSNALFQFFWTGLFIVSSLYSFFWDVYMDWGLGRPEFSFLGPRLMYPERLHYYGVICADFFLRGMWVITLVPPQSGANFELPAYLTAVTMTLELFRRTMWGQFRLENEHRQNTEGYRRVGFVPLHFNTGHDHKYKKESEHVGRNVLGEVAAITAVVVAVGVASVIAAQTGVSNL